MLDLKFLRQNREKVEAGVALKGMAVDLGRFYEVEARRLAVLHETEQLKARRNAASEAIAVKKRSGEDAANDIAAMRDVGDRIKGLDAELKRLEEESETLAAWIPNLPHASVPPGSGPEQNQVVRTWGEKKHFDFEPKPHWDLATSLGLLDFERAAKISGSGFLLFTGRRGRARADPVHAGFPRRASPGVTGSVAAARGPRAALFARYGPSQARVGHVSDRGR
jgi:seryl-tRNA synthetase